MGYIEMLPVLTLACMLHETGHILLTLILGGKITEVTVSCFGIQMAGCTSMSYLRESIAVIAGPVFGMTAALIAACLGFYYFAGLSFVLSVFNLLPLRILDGGRFLSCLMLSRFELETSEKISKMADVITLFAFFSAAVYLLVYFGNITLLCCTGVLLFIYCQEQ